jgi:ubiquinone/menaquinone biosynthesis C-methylase UbiE
MVRRYYHERGWRSPYQQYQDLLQKTLPRDSVVLDIGCGRSFPLAPFLLQCAGQVHGIDPVADENQPHPGVTLKRADACQIPYESGTFDVVTSQSVLEHLDQPLRAFREMHRVLKPQGRMVFLAANKYDYVSLIAMLLPNIFHAAVVLASEGRATEDTFPTHYRANSNAKIAKLARKSGFFVEKLHYLNQFPYALMFSPTLCRLGIAYDQFLDRFCGLHWLKGGLLGCLKSQ